MDTSQIVLIAVVGLFSLLAAVLDVRTHRLPNWLTVSGFVSAVLFHAVSGALHNGWAGLGQGLLLSLGGFATGFGILLVLWLIGGGGGGDVKLMGALGAWLGWKFTLYVFFLSVVFAILLSTIVLVVQAARHGFGHVQRRYLNRVDASNAKHNRRAANQRAQRHEKRRRVLPYALPVALGTWLVIAWQVVLLNH
jgi:prepilin peptidase CpaA